MVYAAAIGAAVTWLVEAPDRPMTVVQTMIFYVLSYLPGLGIAMLSDPAPAKVKAECMKVDYYAPKTPSPAAGAAELGNDAAAAGATQEGGTV